MTVLALTKTINVKYTLGSAGVPSKPGSPAIPAYNVTTTKRVPVFGVYPSIPGINPNTITDLTGPDINRQIPLSYKNVTTTIYYPGTPAVAATPGRAASAGQTTQDFNLGWNSSAVAIASMENDGRLAFESLPSTQGAVVGLSGTNPGKNYREIAFGLYVSNGFVQVIESGVLKGSQQLLLAADVLSIERRGGVITYYLNDALFYASETSSAGTLLALADLYAGGDSVINALFAPALYGDNYSDTSAQPASARSASSASSAASVSLQPVTSTSSGTTYVGARVSLQPVTGFSSESASSRSTVTLQPVTSDAYDDIQSPDYAVSAVATAFVVSAGHMFTGEIGDADVVTQSVESLSANYAYGTTIASAQPVLALSFEFPKVDGYALTGLTSKFSLVASGSERPQNTFAGELSFGATARAGHFAKVAMPNARLLATGVGVVVGRAYLSAPPSFVTASGKGGGVARATMTLSTSPTLRAYSGAVLSVRVGGQYKVTASGTQGGLAKATMRLPLCTLVASGKPALFGRAVLTGPAMRAAPSSRALMLAPGFKLVAYGTAVVALDYEAYAVNLLTAADNNPQNQYELKSGQVTHYTNFPFTQIVRHHNSYYGVAADGLYLLEGDTDAGAPIAWSFRTALTDASSKQFKRVRSVYIGGRLISQVTVTLVVGEAQDLTYAYTTPRGSDLQTYRQMFGKGVRTRYFAIELSDATGGFIEIDSLDLENEILERAI